MNKSLNSQRCCRSFCAVRFFITFLFFVPFVFNLLSCKKLVEIDSPSSSVNQGNVYKNDATATAVLTGLYTTMGTNSSFCTGRVSTSLICGLSADEFKLSNAVSDSRMIAHYHNSLSANPVRGSEYWESMYQHVFICNSAIEGLNESSSLTANVKEQLVGEAKFARAFVYFYLTNLFGDVPLALSTDPKVNAIIPRSSQSTVYDQIISDLKDAQDKLHSNYLDGSLKEYTGPSERLRPTKWAATALLARVYLFKNDFVNADIEATKLINNKAIFDTVPLNIVFNKNSEEAIWQLQPVGTGWNTEDARIFVINASPGDSRPISLSQSLVSSFELNDGRKLNWIRDTTLAGEILPYPFKYKIAKRNEPVTEYLMVFRIAEQYLIRAEARAHLNNISGAQTDLNVIRNRAGLGNTTANDKTSLIAAIMQERRIEFFSEWGHRWFDLKRTGSVDAVMNITTPIKGSVWQTHQKLYPVPISDIEKNPGLVQNPGY